MGRAPHDRWVQGNDSGTYTSTVDKLGLHTTEGGSIAGAIAAYKANNSWPHTTVECRFGHTYERCGHLDLDVAARSFRNEAGGVQTNRDGVVQIEVVGFATRPSEIDWAWLGEHVVGPICQLKGIPVQSSVVWRPYPASYGEGASQRLSAAQWTAYQGVLGHQHVPENSHGDPGAIPILVLLGAAKQAGGPIPKEDSLSAEEVAAIKSHIDNTVRPFLVKAPDDPAVFVDGRDGTLRWVDSQDMLKATRLDGVQHAGTQPDGVTPTPFTNRSEAALRSLHIVGPVPPGWD